MARELDEKHGTPAEGRRSLGWRARSAFHWLRRHWPAVFGILAYLLGGAGRFTYALWTHSPRDSVVFDAVGIANLSQRLLDAEAIQQKGDTIWPPGTSAFLAWMSALDPTLVAAAVVQVIAACLIPLMVGHATWLLFDRSRAAWVALAMASLHFGFIHYTGFFLSEQLFQFAATFAIWVSLIVVRQIDCDSKSLSRPRLVLLGATLGAPWALAAHFRPNALPLVLALSIALGAYWLWRGERRKCWSLLGAIVILPVLMAPAAHRCTKMKEQGFCPVSANFAMNVALGQAGAVGQVDFVDPKTNRDGSNWGPPSLAFHRFRGKITIPATIWDTSGVLSWVGHRIAEDPGGAFIRALGNGLDLFGVTYWPEVYGRLKPRVATVAAQVFFVLVLIPGLVGWWRSLKTIRRRRATSSMVLVVSGMLAVFLLGCISHGEARYRMPFDLFWIALAAGLVTPLSGDGVGPSRAAEGRPIPPFGAAFAAISIALLIMISHPDIAIGHRLAQRDLLAGLIVRKPASELSQIKHDGDPRAECGVRLRCGSACPELRVEWKKMRRALRVELSLDHNDRYRVHFYREGSRVGQADARSDRRRKGGLRVVRLAVPIGAASGFDAIGIVPLYGDSRYSVGHVRLLRR
jgi:hypothetical protein